MTLDVPMTAMPGHCDSGLELIFSCRSASEQAASFLRDTTPGAAMRVALVQSACCFLACLVWCRRASMIIVLV